MHLSPGTRLTLTDLHVDANLAAAKIGCDLLGLTPIPHASYPADRRPVSPQAWILVYHQMTGTYEVFRYEYGLPLPVNAQISTSHYTNAIKRFNECNMRAAHDMANLESERQEAVDTILAHAEISIQAAWKMGLHKDCVQMVTDVSDGTTWACHARTGLRWPHHTVESSR